MVTFSALLAICAGNSLVTGEFPAQRPVTRSFDVFLYLRLNERLSKQSWGWWFETPSRPLWCYSNVTPELRYASRITVPLREGGPQSEFSSQRVSNSKLYLFVSQKKLLNKQSSCRWVQMPAHSYDVTAIFIMNKVRVLVHQAHCLRTWNNLNPSMDNESHAQYSVGWNYLPIPKLQRLYRWS